MNKKFYDILNSGEYDCKALAKLHFKMDSKGPNYIVTLLKFNPNPMDIINNNEFKLEMLSEKGCMEITDFDSKKNILERLFYNKRA